MMTFFSAAGLVTFCKLFLTVLLMFCRSMFATGIRFGTRMIHVTYTKSLVIVFQLG